MRSRKAMRLSAARRVGWHVHAQSIEASLADNPLSAPLRRVCWSAAPACPVIAPRVATNAMPSTVSGGRHVYRRGLGRGEPRDNICVVLQRIRRSRFLERGRLGGMACVLHDGERCGARRRLTRHIHLAGAGSSHRQGDGWNLVSVDMSELGVEAIDTNSRGDQ